MMGRNNKLRFDGTKAMREARMITTKRDRSNRYGIVDARLNRSVTGFERTFRRVCKGERMKNYIETVLEKMRGEAIGIEFGGLAINLFNDFDKGLFKQTIGISLSDYRTGDGQLKNGGQKMVHTDGRQHNIIIGNLLDDSIYKKINKIIKGKKADLIIERMIAGLNNIPNNFLVVMTILQRWYNMLNEGGLLLVQVPDFAVSVVEEWLKILQGEKYRRVLDVDFDEFRGALRIHKLKGAPERLPKLKLEKIKEITQIKK